MTTGHPGVAPVLDILPGASFLATADHDVRVFQPRNGGGTTRRIAVVHAFPGLGEVRANRLLLEKAIRMAAAAGARWIVTPELSESGCADAYGPEIARDYARLGVDLLLSSAAWAPGSMGPNGVWEDRSRETGLPLVVCNRTGAEPGLSWVEAESVVDLVGRRLFTFQSPETRVFLVDWDRQKMTFTEAGSFKIEGEP